MIYFYLYEIKNLINGKIYVGVHKTRDLNDGYMGSGKRIRSAITKHGITNFAKVILETFENAEAMYAREKEIVTEEFLSRKDVYNLRRGGTGGFDYINQTPEIIFPRNKKCSERKIQKLLRDSKFREYCANQGRAALKLVANIGNSKVNRRKAVKTGIKNYGKWNIWHVGLKRSDETKQKMSRSGSGKNNSQFGTMWITNGIKNLRIKKLDCIPEGWTKGRKVKTIVL